MAAHRRFSLTRPLVAAALSLALIAPLTAQGAEPVGQFRRQMLDLAQHLGALHHLRSLCRQDESVLWRDAMKEMMRLETGESDWRRQLTRRFNAGFRAASQEHSRCSATVETAARREAEAARALVTALDTALE